MVYCTCLADTTKRGVYAWSGSIWVKLSGSSSTSDTAKADKTTTISTTAPLTGGGSLAANRTFGFDTTTGHNTTGFYDGRYKPVGTFELPSQTGNNGKYLTTNGSTASWGTVSGGWGLTGNSGTTAGTNFIGTTDNKDVVIKRNNVVVGRFYEDRLILGYASSTGSVGANFIGNYCGDGATNAMAANFIGDASGSSATNAEYSNFIGSETGGSATNAYYSNFLGRETGLGATNAYHSNFIGRRAGYYASAANNSNFIGQNAGSGATNAEYSNFIGYNAGVEGTNAKYSVFIGGGSGSEASNATRSVFIGFNSGSSALNAHRTILIGANSGSPGLASNNVIIGTNITLPDSSSNSMNIAGVLFAKGISTIDDALIKDTPSSTGQIGIGIVTPATSAILDLTSTNKGLLLPRMTKTQRDAIPTPVAGLMVYQTDNTPGLRVYNGTNWMRFTETID
jgi:hypothetical protein